MITKKAGCFLIRRETKEVALIYRKKQDDYSFPKGHVEEGETLKDAGFPSESLDEELIHSFALDTLFGYMKFVTTKEGESIPIDVLYGIPTTSLNLCNQVIEQIEKRNMLGEENIEKMKEETKRISSELDEFVQKWSCNNGHPVRPIVALNGKLQWI